MYCLEVWHGTKNGWLRSIWMTRPKCRQQLAFPRANHLRLSPPLPTPPYNHHTILPRRLVAAHGEPELISLNLHVPNPNHSRNLLCVRSVATMGQKERCLLGAGMSIAQTAGEHTYTLRFTTKAKWRSDAWMSRAKYRQTTDLFDGQRRRRTLHDIWSCSFGTMWRIHLI